MLLHMCRCGKLIPQSVRLCDKCEAAAGQRYKDYNEHRRDGKAAAFYVSKEWRRIRPTILERFDYIDLYAYQVLHEIRRAETVHHIDELASHWERRLDVANLIPLAEATHRHIHTLYDRDEATKAATKALLFSLVEEQQRQGVGDAEKF